MSNRAAFADGGDFYQAIGEQLAVNARSFRLFFYADGPVLVPPTAFDGTPDAESVDSIGREAIAAAHAEWSGGAYDARSRAAVAAVIRRVVELGTPRCGFFVCEALGEMKP